MDLNRVIYELERERDRVQKIIESLELVVAGVRDGLLNGNKPQGRSRAKAATKSYKERRGRKSMGAEERQQVAQRMRLYWEKRRQQEGKSGEPTAGQVGKPQTHAAHA